MMNLPATEAPRIDIQQLSFAYSSVVLFQQLSLQIQGGITFITGNESCGKTTLLRLIAGELPVQQGTLNIITHHAHQPVIFWADPLATDDDDTVVSDYFASLHNHYPHLSQSQLALCIEGLSLSVHLEKKFSMLSTGTKRKVWIAAALASGADVILLDNPEAALDGNSVRFIYQYLAQQLHDKKQAVMITCYEVPEQLTAARQITLPDPAV